LAGSSPVTIVAPSSRATDGDIALHVWTFPQKSGAAKQRLLIVHVSNVACLFLSAVELMPSTAQRSAPRPPKTRAATSIARTPNSGGIRVKFFNKIKGRKSSSLDEQLSHQRHRWLQIPAGTSQERTFAAIRAAESARHWRR